MFDFIRSTGNTLYLIYNTYNTLPDVLSNAFIESSLMPF